MARTEVKTRVNRFLKRVIMLKSQNGLPSTFHFSNRKKVSAALQIRRDPPPFLSWKILRSPLYPPFLTPLLHFAIFRHSKLSQVQRSPNATNDSPSHLHHFYNRAAFTLSSMALLARELLRGHKEASPPRVSVVATPFITSGSCAESLPGREVLGGSAYSPDLL